MTRARELLLLLVPLAIACRGREEGGGGEAPEASTPRPTVAATVVPVGTAAFAEEVEAAGMVTARAGRVAQLAAPAPARISRVAVAVGASVAAGAPLVEFERAPFEAALHGAERALEAAQQASRRAQRLTEVGVLPRKDAEAAAADLAAAEANAVTARRAFELVVLRAPFAGTVTRMSAVLGASVDASAPLVEIADPRAQDVVLQVSPGDAAGIRVGATVSLAAAAVAGVAHGDALGRGRVVDVAAAVDSASGGVPVRIAVTGTVRPLRFGETVVGRVAVRTHDRALVVPAEALVPNGEGFRVFVVDSAGVAHATDVLVGSRSPAGVWIRDGLHAGDRIVTAGAYGMDDAAMVVPVKP